MLNPLKTPGLVQSFTTLLQQWGEYQALQGQLAYSAEQFQWFRPERVTDLQNREQISEPYSVEELDEHGRTYITEDMTVDTSKKEFAVLDLEASVLQSFARAFNERHTSKLRHFSHSAGVSDIISKPGTGAIDQIETFAATLLKAP